MTLLIESLPHRNKDVQYYRMDALTLGTFLSPILTFTTVWNTGETVDNYFLYYEASALTTQPELNYLTTYFILKHHHSVLIDLNTNIQKHQYAKYILKTVVGKSYIKVNLKNIDFRYLR